MKGICSKRYFCTVFEAAIYVDLWYLDILDSFFYNFFWWPKTHHVSLQYLYIYSCTIGLAPIRNIIGPSWVFGTGPCIYSQTALAFLWFYSGNILQRALLPESKTNKLNRYIVQEKVHFPFFASRTFWMFLICISSIPLFLVNTFINSV